MQNVANLITVRRVLFPGLGAFIITRSWIQHDCLALAFAVLVAGYGWFVRG